MVRGNPPPVKTGVFNKGFHHPSSAGMVLMHVSCHMSKYTQKTGTPSPMKLTCLLVLNLFWDFSSPFFHLLICVSWNHYVKSLPELAFVLGWDQNKDFSQYPLFIYSLIEYKPWVWAGPWLLTINTVVLCPLLAMHDLVTNFY